MTYNIFLIRHGQSLGNVDEDVYRTHADHMIPLSPLGVEQAIHVSDELNGILHRRNIQFVDFWHSPYLRAVQTSNIISENCPNARSSKQAFWLAERQFGLFDGIPNKMLPTTFPNEWLHFNKCAEFGGKFWARMPMGESPFDVSVRLHQFINTVRSDFERGLSKNIVIIAHATVITLFRMLIEHKDVEWFEQEPNGNNCEIFHISGRSIYEMKDHGSVFGGYK